MVTNVTSLSGNGVFDWLVQRISAVVLLCYFIFLAFYLGSHADLTYAQWQDLFASDWMRGFTILALISLCAHGWVGLWTISTDYLTPTFIGSAAMIIRLGFQLACLLVLFAYAVWSVQILWSI